MAAFQHELYSSTHLEIAEELNVSRSTADNITQRALVKAKFEYLKYYTEEEIKDYLRWIESDEVQEVRKIYWLEGGEKL